MEHQDSRKPAEEKRSDNPTSTPQVVESQHTEPPVPDWMFKVAEVKSEKTSIHPYETKDEQSESTYALVDRIKRSDRWMIFLTAIISLATLGNFIVFWRSSMDTSTQIDKLIKQATQQAIATQHLAEASKNQAADTGKLANATKDAASAARDQVKAGNRLADVSGEANTIARQNLVNADRPWVGTSRSTIVNVEAGKAPTLTSLVENFGKTPALEVEQWVVFGITKASNPTSELIKFVKTLPSKRVGTVFPGQRLSQDFNLSGKLTEQGITGIMSGKIELSKFGFLRYKDRWNNIHHTWLYDFYDPKLKAIVHIRREGTPSDD